PRNLLGVLTQPRSLAVCNSMATRQINSTAAASGCKPTACNCRAPPGNQTAACVAVNIPKLRTRPLRAHQGAGRNHPSNNAQAKVGANRMYVEDSVAEPSSVIQQQLNEKSVVKSRRCSQCARRPAIQLA